MRVSSASASFLDSSSSARRIDLMGMISGILAPNEMYSQVCGCAERLGIRLKLKHNVPARLCVTTSAESIVRNAVADGCLPTGVFSDRPFV